MKYYIKTHSLDYIFTSLISLSLAVNIFSSFVIETSYLSNYVVLIVVACLINAILFCLGYNKKTTIAGIVLVVATLSVAVFYFVKNGGDTYFLFLILAVTVLGTFLLTRNKKLLILFAIGATFSCAAFEFLQYPTSTVFFFLMIVGLVLEILYKTYFDSLLAASYGTFNFKHFAVQSIAIVLVVLSFSSAVFYGVIKPLDPDTREIKLVTELLSWDVVERIGISKRTQLESENSTTMKKNNQKLEKEEEQEEEPEEQDKQNEQKAQSNALLEAFAIAYKFADNSKYILIAIGLFLIALPFIIKFSLRRSRKKKIESFEPIEGCVFLYEYFLKKFYKLKLGRPNNLTLFEYNENYKNEFSKFDMDANVKFDELTRIYVSQTYGTYEPCEADYTLFKEYYNNFFKSAKNYIGKFKYLIKFWSL